MRKTHTPLSPIRSASGENEEKTARTKAEIILRGDYIPPFLFSYPNKKEDRVTGLLPHILPQESRLVS